MVTGKLRRNAQITIPKPVRTLLDLREGDTLHFALNYYNVVLTKLSPERAIDPFVAFTEWDSEADRRGYADL
jgi:antitoxin PrlF